MPVQHKATQGLLYERAAGFAEALEAGNASAADELLAAWSTSYWGVRQEMDNLFAKIAAAKATGETPSPAWAYQQQRLKRVLDTAKTQMAQYAEYASEVTSKAQQSAIAAGLKHAETLAKTTVAQDLPDLAFSFARVNPAVLQSGVGFLTNGSPLRDLLTTTLPAETAQALQDTLLKGLGLGWGQDKMLREMTHAYGLGHSRAVTILRTESLRSYRHATRSTYMANQDVLEGWVWNAHLDSRTCLACALMDGTVHPIDATLDGHPRCRCAMVPRTKTWADLTGQDLPDSRPPIRSGKAWLEAQPAHVQRAMMGPRKFDAWLDGAISLDDMVARTYHPAWGTTRTERSLKAILEGRNENYFDVAAPPPPKPPPAPKPNKAHVLELVEEHDLRYLEKWAKDPEGTGPQGLADLHAAIAYKTNRLGEVGPSLPDPDPTSVAGMVTKMNGAVATKGYPSKGYSQVVAIYKAKANGTPGTQVGVVKSLTWQQKLDASEALRQHNEALPGLIRAHEKQQAILNAWDEAKAMDVAITKAKAEAAEKALQQSIDNAVQATAKTFDQAMVKMGAQPASNHDAVWSKVLADLKDLQHDLDDFPTGSPEWKMADAQAKTLMAKMDEYDDAKAFMVNTHKGTDWKPSDGGNQTLHVNDDGWVTMTMPVPGGEPTVMGMAPHFGQKMIQATDGITWEQVLTPDPTEVQKWLTQVIQDADGLVTQKMYDKTKATLEKATMAPQDALNLQTALDEAWALGKWKPEPDWVDIIVKQLDKGIAKADDLKATLANPATKPLSKANIQEALVQWEAQQVAKAAIPKVKPVIDPAKFDFSQASQKAVDAWVTKVQSGSLSLDDLYAKFQASKNKGHKTNVAKAILDLEGKPTTPAVKWPTETDEPIISFIQTQMSEGLKSGQWSMDEVVSVATGGGGSTGAAQQLLLDLYHAGDIGEDFLVKAGIKPLAAPKPVIPSPTLTKAATSKPDPWPANPPWKPEDLSFTGTTLGTHGAQVWKAKDGTKWLFKPPKDPKDGFLVTLDEAASRIQALAGSKAPDTYVVTLGGKRGSIQRMFDATDGFPGGFRPGNLTEQDMGVVQREHVLDWLLSNHDGHRDQFLRLQSGDLAAIDKGQAFRWFGQDRLDWDFHPNSAYGAPEPVYNALWRDFAQGGKTEVDLAALQRAVADVQGIADNDLRRLLRPYAEQAASRGLLAKRQQFPGLKAPAIPENDVEAFLDAVVARKAALAKDFQDLYDRAVKARQRNLPGWTPKAPTGKSKWFGVDAPKPPTPPKSPEAQTASLFDSWLQDAKDRYATFSGGKALDASHNWARFRRVIDDLDETAIQELQDRHYLDAATAQQARDLIAQAKAQKATLAAEHKRAMVAHDQAMRLYKSDLQDWKDANGIIDLLAGMDDDVLRHGTNPAGEKWAQKHFDEMRYTATQRRWLKSYTGSAYDDWNSHLRQTKGKPTQYADAIKNLDKAMEAQPIPEDVILHRGSNLVTLSDGTSFSGSSDLSAMVGNVLVDHGYMSTSVGKNAAFSGHSIQLKIRAKAGTPGSYVQMFSSFSTERELILARGTHLYVHNAYKSGHQWVVECEVVADDFDAATATPRPSTNPWSPS